MRAAFVTVDDVAVDVAVDVALCPNVGEGVMALPTDDVGAEVDVEGADVDVEGAEVGAVVEVDVGADVGAEVYVDGVVDISCSFAVAAGLRSIWAALSLVPHEPVFKSED